VLNTSNVVQSACGNNGSITNLNLTNSGGYQITDQNNNLISSNKDATNLAPGIYTITTGNSTCASKFLVQIFDATPQIDSDYVQITQPSCGQSNGTIQNLFLSSSNNQILQNDYSAYTYKWLDAGGKIVGTGMDAGNLAVGVYHLEVSYKGNCSTTYGPVTLKNATGPNIDQSNVKVQSTNCGQSTGSITNIPATGTGTLKYSWVNNSTQQTVSTDSILVNQPAGTYKLQVTDDTQCGPVYSSTINIPETNGITMDESKAVTTPASCGNNNGTVKGIIITDATQYQWLDANNNTVGTSVDLQNVPSGNYTLTASNGFGCSVTSKTYFIAQPPGTIYPNYAASFSASCFGQNNGSLTVTTDALAKTLRWVNSQNQPAGNTPNINGLAPDVYTLYLTDANGCESVYGHYNVPGAAQIQIVPGSEQITPDQCSTKTGSIDNIEVTGGIPPYSYSWTDQNNAVFSSSASVSGLAAGIYQLGVNDSKGCGLVTASYTLSNQDNTISPPLVSNVGLCTPGTALVQVQNVVAGYSYRLYDSGTSTPPIDEQTSGVFKVTANANTSYFVSQFIGSCESSRTKVNVTVGLSGVNIANTFTPNGDGINDYWQIAGIENYPDALVQVFNRYGQKLFESKGYSIPFDGTYKGQKLASGVYYYIINLNTKCNLLSGNLTILR
jgi:gliding motility-associated-like protein